MAYTNPRQSPIDFDSYIADRTHNFTGRQWVFEKIQRWLADKDAPRFFLLTGDPGSGKSAIAARLCQYASGKVTPPDGLSSLGKDCVSAFHFCSARNGGSLEPETFAKSIALQLSERFPAYGLALAEQSGDRQIRIENYQQVRNNEGRVIGVIIKSLDVSGVSASDVFNRVVRQPLKAFCETFVKTHPGEWITIGVDALDEALGSSTKPNIVNLLAAIEDFPANVHFILTSRRDKRIENEFRLVKPMRLHISGEPSREANLADVRDYVHRRLEEDTTLAAHVPTVDPGELDESITTITTKSAGNFLYVTFLLDAIAQGQRKWDDLRGLPIGLDELYADSLHRVVKLGKDDWNKDYAPLMGILSVARDSLTIKQLLAFTGQSETSVREHLGDLEQFIRSTKAVDADGKTILNYALYHQSLVDFLSREWLGEEEGEDSNPFYLLPKDQHCQIVDFYRDGANNWNNPSKVDEYGLRHLASHLDALKEDSRYRQQLFELICKPFMEKSHGVFHTHTSFSSAIDLAWGVACTQGNTPENVALLVRLQTARQVVNSVVRTFSDTDLQTLVGLGREWKALNYLRLRQDPKQRFDGLLSVYAAEREKEKADPSLLDEASAETASIIDIKSKAEALTILAGALVEAGQSDQANVVFEQARQAADGILDDRDRSKAEALRKIARAFAEAGQFNQVKQVVETSTVNGIDSDVLRELAIALAKAERYDQAQEVIDAIKDVRLREWALRELAGALAQAKKCDRAQQLVETIEHDDPKVWALCEVALAFAQAGQSDRANILLDQAHKIATATYSRPEVLSSLAGALAQVGQSDRAAPLFEQALGVANASTNDFRKVEMLSRISGDLVQAGKPDRANAVFDQALSIAPTITVNEVEAWGLSRFVGALAGKGQYDQAEQIADAIRHDYQRARALINLAQALTQAGKSDRANAILDRARQVALPITESRREGLLCELTKALAQAGQYDQAQQVAEAMTVDDTKTAALSTLAGALARAKQYDRAGAVFGQARQVAEAITVDDTKAAALCELVETLAHSALYDQACQVAEAITVADTKAAALRELVETLAHAGLYDRACQVTESITAEIIKVQALSNLALALAQAGQSDRAYAIFHQGQQVADTITGNLSKGEALSELAGALAQAGQYDQAQQIASTIIDNSRRAWALSHMAGALARAAQYDQARQIISTITYDTAKAAAQRDLAEALCASKQYAQAREVVDAITADDAKAEAMRELTQALAQARLYDQAQQMADAIAVDEAKARAVSALAGAFARAGQYDRARQLVDAIKSPSLMAKALSALAGVLIETGQLELASAVFEQAQQATEAITDILSRADARRHLATILAQAGRYKDALFIMGNDSLDIYIGSLARWAPFFEQTERGLSLRVLLEATQVAAWQRKDWQAIYRLLTTSGEIHSLSI